MTPEETVLLLNTILGFSMFGLLTYRVIKSGALKKGDPTGVNPLNYLFKKMPEQTYTFNQPLAIPMIWLFSIVGITNIAWVLVNVPELQGFATVYLFMALIPGFVGFFEYSVPLKSRALAAVNLGWDRFGEQIFAGLVIATPFVMTNALFTVKSQVMEELAAMPVASFIFTVIIVPLIEEGNFRGALAPTIAKELGVIPSTILTSFVFMIFHAMAYEWTIPLLIYVFLFSVAATFVDLYYKSVLPSWIAHTLVNMSAMMFVIGSGFMP